MGTMRRQWLLLCLLGLFEIQPSFAWSHYLSIHNKSTLPSSRAVVEVSTIVGGVDLTHFTLDNDESRTLEFTDDSSFSNCPGGFIGLHCDAGKLNLKFWQGGDILRASSCQLNYAGLPLSYKFDPFETQGNPAECRHFVLSHECPSGLFNCIDIVD